MYAYNEAVEHYTAAVALWSSADATGLDHAAVLLDAADAAHRAGADELPIQWLELGLAALGEHPDPLRAATFFERLGRFQDHHLDKSLTFYNEALLCLDETASAERARLLGDESLTLTLSVRWDEARDRAERALSSRRKREPKPRRGSRARSSGSCSPTSGSSSPAEAHLEAARRIGELLERPEDVSRAYVHLGEVRRLRGDLPGALEVMAAGLRRRAASASRPHTAATSPSTPPRTSTSWAIGTRRRSGSTELEGRVADLERAAAPAHRLRPARRRSRRLRARARARLDESHRAAARVVGDGVDGVRRPRSVIELLLTAGESEAGAGDRDRRARTRERA